MTPPGGFRSLQQMGVVMEYLRVSIALFEVVSPMIWTALVNEDNNLGREWVRGTAVALTPVRYAGEVLFQQKKCRRWNTVASAEDKGR